MPVYVISPSRKKPAHATLKAVSTFSSSMLIGLSVVIYSSISFVIGKRMAFGLENTLLPPLIMSLMRGVSNAFRLSWRSTW